MSNMPDEVLADLLAASTLVAPREGGLGLVREMPIETFHQFMGKDGHSECAEVDVKLTPSGERFRITVRRL